MAEPRTAEPLRITTTKALHQVAFEAYGVRALVSASSGYLLARLKELFPPGWRETPSQPGDPHFILTPGDDLNYKLTRNSTVLATAELEVALLVFDAQLRAHVALHAPDRIFVHAGAVGYRGRAILIPGRSFSGKTTLVSELLHAGASYYSDEYAILDDTGMVHPYAKPLSLRLEEGSDWQTDRSVADFGGVAGVDPLPVALIVSAQYRVGADWQPERLTSGDGALELLANTVPAQERPEQSLLAIRRAVERATILKGDRGEAAAVAPRLLELVLDGG
jgi:hypothetical protein